MIFLKTLAWGLVAAFLRLTWHHICSAQRRRTHPLVTGRPIHTGTPPTDGAFREYIARAHPDDMHNTVVILARSPELYETN